MSTSGGGDAPTAKRLRVGERTMLACNNCKQRKLKCDAQIPKCKNCAKTDRECLIEDPATGLHRPRDYIRSLESQANYLESRVAYLENMLKESRPEVAADHFGAYATAVPGNSELSLIPLSGLRSRTVPLTDGINPRSRAEAPAADVLSDEVALLCLSAAGREPQYFGPSSALSFSQIASSVMGLPRHGHDGGSQRSNNGDGPDRARQRRQLDTQLNSRLLKAFPSPDKMSQLSQAYFKNIHLQYPFLHRPTVQAMEQECLDAHIQSGLIEAEDTSLFFLLMIYAIGSLALGKEEVDNAEIYYSLALEYIGPIIEMDNLQSIQAILCCAVYSIRSPIGVSLWKLSGMAIRHCVELGYHRSVKMYRGTADELTKEMSKRCFWVAYDIDRVASFILGRPVGIADSAIDVELPADINDEDITAEGLQCEPRTNVNDPPTTMTAALHAMKLRQLWSKFNDNLYAKTLDPKGGEPSQMGPSIEALRQELEEWRAAIPEKGPEDSGSGKTLSVFASKNWFQLAYDHSILLLYRHYIIDNHGWYQEALSPSKVGLLDARDRAFELCADHARNICLIYRHLYQTQGAHVQFTWGSLHILFLAGLSYLYCLWRSPGVRQKTKPTTVMNTSMACTTVLIIIADRWPAATSYREIFETLSERTINMLYGENESLVPESGMFLPNNGGIGVSAAAVAAAPAMFNEAGDANGSFNAAQSGMFADFNAMGGAGPVQDWITALDGIEAPGDSHWLAQELFQGFNRE